jgi:hypothetical protein
MKALIDPAGLKLIRILPLAFLACLMMDNSSARDFVIVQDGRPAATIVTAATSSENARDAALELQQYVHRISGAELPIVNDSQEHSGSLILVGPSRNKSKSTRTGLRLDATDLKILTRPA